MERFCAAASDICSVRLNAADSVLADIKAKLLAVFWLLARKVLMVPSLPLAAPCKVPSNPPGLAAATSNSWASLSQLGAVLEARLTGVTAMRGDPIVQSHFSGRALTNPDR